MLLPPTDATIVARRAEIVAALKAIVPDGVVADKSGLATFDSDALSAYHQIKDGTKYPAVLALTGVNDPRVPSWMVAEFSTRLTIPPTEYFHPVAT